MDTWTNRKFSNWKFPSKSEKSWHTHMKQINFPLTFLKFTWLAIDGFKEKKTFLPKRKLGPPNTKGPQEIWNFPSPLLQDKKKISPHKRNICGWGGGRVYTMENKDTNTDCQKVSRVGNQVRNCRNYNQTQFLFQIRIHIYIFTQGVFKSHLKKNHPHLKCQFLPNIPIWHKALLYRPKKLLNPLPPLPHHPRGEG